MLDREERQGRRPPGSDRTQAIMDMRPLRNDQVPYWKDMLVLGKVQAHYHIALDRLIEGVHSRGWHHVHQLLPARAEAELRQHLGLKREFCKSWLKPSPVESGS